jgi:hypothetical protein
MGGNQSKISVNTATENLVESIMNTTQKSAINTNISQDVLIDGREYARDQSAKYLACTRDNINKKPNEILEICMPLAPGSIEDVTVKGTFDISKSTTLTAKSIQDSASNIVNDISAKQEQSNSGFSINEEAKTNIVSNIKQHSKLIADTINEAMSTDNFNQKLEIRSGNTKGVSMDLFIKQVTVDLNTVDVFQQSVQDTIQDIETKNTQKNSGLGNILIVVVVILSIILISFFVYKMYSRKGGKSKKSKRSKIPKQDSSEEGSDGEDSGEHGSSKSAFSASSYIGMFIGVAIIALLITIIVLNSKNKKDNNVDVKCNNGKCETE